jgi:hypothetical protein
MVNFGVVKSKVSRVLGEHYVNNAHQSAEAIYKEYIELVKNSPILMLEYVVFHNLERNNMSMDRAAKYIDNNISLLQRYNKKDILRENEKLKSLDVSGVLAEGVSPLHQAIQTLILESAQTTGVPNVNKIHDSFDYIIEHMTTSVQEKEVVLESDFNFDNIMTVAERKINEKYTHLSEDVKKILGVVMNGSPKDKESLMESLKLDAISLLKDDVSDESISAISIISEMTYKDDSFVENILSLYELLN